MPVWRWLYAGLRGRSVLLFVGFILNGSMGDNPGLPGEFDLDLGPRRHSGGGDVCWALACGLDSEGGQVDSVGRNVVIVIYRGDAEQRW